MSKESKTSKQLMYSEYLNTTVAEHAIQSVEKKAKTKPVMQYVKSPVLDRVTKLLPELEHSNKELIRKLDGKNMDIEDLENSKTYIEMNVAVIKDVPEEDLLEE
ncbi:hypothetical protein X975_00898, partial [Stegodyphus mimosarum]